MPLINNVIQKLPLNSKISFNSLGSDLLTENFLTIQNFPKWKYEKKFLFYYNCTIKDKETTIDFSYSCKKNNENVIKLLGYSDIEDLTEIKKQEIRKNDKITCLQTYKLTFNKSNKLPFIQFRSKIDDLEINGHIFKKNEIITLIIVYKNYYSNPYPCVLTVEPKEHQLIVPLIPKQKLLVYTKANQEIKYSTNKNLSVLFCNSLESDVDLNCNMFFCSKNVTSSENIEVIANQIKKQIIIPHVETYKNSIIPIIHPKVTCELIVNNFNMFLVKVFKQNFRPIVSDNKNARIINTYEKEHTFERLFYIENPTSSIKITNYTNKFVVS